MNEKIILVGTKKAIVFVDIIRKERIKKVLLNYNAYSICHFQGNIYLGLKNNINSCLLFEYTYNKEYSDINFECRGKGLDKCLEISYITCLDEKAIITCDKYNSIKIWKVTERKPKTMLFGNNPDYCFEEDYESEDEKEV